MINSTTLIILFGIANIILHVIIHKRSKRKITLGSTLNAFLNGFVPYGALAAFYSGFTSKPFLGSVAQPCLDENYRVVLITAGLSLGWLYYHIFFKELRKKR